MSNAANLTSQCQSCLQPPAKTDGLQGIHGLEDSLRIAAVLNIGRNTISHNKMETNFRNLMWKPNDVISR